MKSFSASAIGWGIPIILTLLGPFRSWIYPSSLRSSSVKNAIASNAQRKIVIVETINLIYIVLGWKPPCLEFKSNALLCHQNGL